MDTRHFFIKPVIPSELKKLSEMAFNVWSCWDMEAQRLFHRLDPQLFRNVDHNPVELLHTIKSVNRKSPYHRSFIAFKNERTDNRKLKTDN